GRREARFEQAGEVARAHRDAGFEIALDQLAENVLAAGVEHREKIFRGLGHRNPAAPRGVRAARSPSTQKRPGAEAPLRLSGGAVRVKSGLTANGFSPCALPAEPPTRCDP